MYACYSPIEHAGETTAIVLAEARTSDTRSSDRTRTVLRVVKVRSPNDEGLARLQNISDGGMMLRLGLPVCLGDTVAIYLEDTRSLAATVVWTEGQNCGVKFVDPLDSAELLNELARRAREGASRPVRLATDAGGVAYTQAGIHPIRVQDVSQRGMKVKHQSGFAEGLPIKVLLGSGIERRGVVRWSKGDVAGVQLLEPLGLNDLASSKGL